MHYVVGWYSNITDAKGRGTTKLTELACEQMCRQLNKQFPALTHFAVHARTGEVPSWNHGAARSRVNGAVAKE